MGLQMQRSGGDGVLQAPPTNGLGTRAYFTHQKIGRRRETNKV